MKNDNEVSILKLREIIKILILNIKNQDSNTILKLQNEYLETTNIISPYLFEIDKKEIILNEEEFEKLKTKNKEKDNEIYNIIEKLRILKYEIEALK
jgi:hypothetical protein